MTSSKADIEFFLAFCQLTGNGGHGMNGATVLWLVVTAPNRGLEHVIVRRSSEERIVLALQQSLIPVWNNCVQVMNLSCVFCMYFILRTEEMYSYLKKKYNYNINYNDKIVNCPRKLFSFLYSLTLYLLYFLNGIIHLSFLVLPIIIFRDIKIRSWSLSANSVEPGYTGWPGKDTFGSNRIRLNIST